MHRFKILHYGNIWPIMDYVLFIWLHKNFPGFQAPLGFLIFVSKSIRLTKILNVKQPKPQAVWGDC